MIHPFTICRNVHAGRPGSCRLTYWHTLPLLALAVSSVNGGQGASVVKGPHSPRSTTAAAAASASNSNGSRYKFITITTPASSYAVAAGINNNEVVTGYYEDSSSNFHGFVWQNGVLETVDYPGAVDTVLNGLNNQGVAIGYYGDGMTNHTVTYSIAKHTWTALPDIPNYTQNDGYCINDGGNAIGNAFGSGNPMAWIWSAGTSSYTFFSVPGALLGDTYPSCINDKNQVVGYYTDTQGVSHGFIKEYGSYITIDVPGVSDTFPDGMNNWGIMQGQTLTGGVAQGFEATPGGAFATVNYPNAAATAIVGINDQGDICGAYGGMNFSPAMAFLAIYQQ